jgi:hypothetical protein
MSALMIGLIVSLANDLVAGFALNIAGGCDDHPHPVGASGDQRREIQ